MTLTTVAPEFAKAIGPYSPAVVADGVVYCSGQIPLNPDTGELVAGDMQAQTSQALTNLAALLEAAGSSLAHVLKTTVYLTDLGDFVEMNEAYAACFGDHKPARVTVQVSALPLQAHVEIDCIARCE